MTAAPAPSVVGAATRRSLVGGVQWWVPYAFLLPALLGTAVFLVVPLVGGLAVWGFQHFEKITRAISPARSGVSAAAPDTSAQPSAAPQTAATSESQAAPSPVNTAAPGLRFVRRGGSVIRDVPKTSGHKLKKEIKGARVTLIAQEADGWAKVTDGNITGWMRASVLGSTPPN